MENNKTNITKILNFLNPNKKSSSVSPQQNNYYNNYHYNHDYEWSAAISALDLSESSKYTIGAPITTVKSPSSSSTSSLSSSPTSSSSSFSYSYPPSPTNANNNHFGHKSSQNMPSSTTKTTTTTTTNESGLVRSTSMQRRSSVSNCHETSKKRLLRAKKAEYEEKMQAFDELINKRRGNNLRTTLAYDVPSY